MHAFKNLLPVLEAKQPLDARVVEQQVAQAFGAEVGVDARRDHDAAMPTRAQQREAAFGEQLVEVQIGADLAAIDGRELMAVFRRQSEVLVHVREPALIREPSLAHRLVLQQLGLLLLELLDRHLVLADQCGMIGKELLGLRLENLPWRIRQHDVEAAAPLDDLVEHIAPVQRVLRSHVGEFDLALLRLAERALGCVPRRLLELDAAHGELVLHDFVHHAVGFQHGGVDVVAQHAQIGGPANVVGDGAVRAELAVLLVEQLAKALAEHVVLPVLGIELVFVHPHQPDERVAGQDVEVDVGQRLQVLHLAHRRDHRQEQAQFGDLAGLFHDVHTVEVVGDDAALDVVAHAGVAVLDLAQPRLQLAAGAQLGAADHRRVNVDQALERGHQERARAHRRVEHGDRRQHDVDELEGGARIHAREHVGHGVERDLGQVQLGHGRLVHALQNELVDAALGEVAGDLGPGVVRAERLLVDVLLEDVAQHVGVDLVGVAAGRVVEVPGEGGEDAEHALERRVGDAQRGAHARLVVGVELELVVQEQAAVQVGHAAGELARQHRAVDLGLGEGLEEQGIQELAEEAIDATLAALGQLGLQVVGVTAIEEELLLHEPDEHQPVQDDRGIPAAVALVGYAFDLVEQPGVLFGVAGKEALGGLLDIERRLNAARGFEHRQAAVAVEFGEFHHHRLQLRRKQVHRLATKVVVAARGVLGFAGGLVAPALDPVPLALAGGLALVGEDQQVLGVALRKLAPDVLTRGFVGPPAGGHHLQHGHTAEFGHHAAREPV